MRRGVLRETPSSLGPLPRAAAPPRPPPSPFSAWEAACATSPAARASALQTRPLRAERLRAARDGLRHAPLPGARRHRRLRLGVANGAARPQGRCRTRRALSLGRIVWPARLRAPSRAPVLVHGGCAARAARRDDRPAEWPLRTCTQLGRSVS
eukprot:2416407-Pleurochrysis_carterae.AAC.2